MVAGENVGNEKKLKLIILVFTILYPGEKKKSMLQIDGDERSIDEKKSPRVIAEKRKLKEKMLFS